MAEFVQSSMEVDYVEEGEGSSECSEEGEGGK